ncbi:hypothetical protein SCUCBS95973_000989 [Sporothrix curviconia]|uniref:Allophanate hydrolase n=1 Tax=Sporothrix curviconia TaxID=1260050 RepID=A0ABP0AUV5_9PEZI
MDELTLTNARPYAFAFVPEHTALVLVDLQRDFVDAGGFGAIQCGSPDVFAEVRLVVPATQPALAAARALGLHVVHTREGHRADLADLSAAKCDRQIHAPNSTQHTATIGDEGPMGRLLVRGEHGHGIVDELQPRPGELVVDKPGKGGFWATSLHRQLMARGVTHLLFCGVTTECCVATTAREASDRGFQCCILTDCTGGFDASFGKASIDMFVSFDGLFGFAATSTELVAHAKLAAASLTATTPAAWDGVSLDLATLQSCYKYTSLSPVDVVHAVYERIEAYENGNPHAWILLRSREGVLADARALQAKYADTDRESLPPLYGVPFAVKDSFDVDGYATTAACPDFAYVATMTAPTVTASIHAGALLIGKTNMDQLATGLSGCRSPYGISASVFSPDGGETRYCSGGSSSGSAVVVGARLVTFAMGTDTAGSGRVPAAFNGIVGFKPTKGTLSYRGVVPCCRSIDTATILAQSVSDARNIWHVIDEYDAQDAFAKDPQSLPLVLTDYRGLQQAGFVYATPPASAMDAASVSPAFRAAFDAALEVVKEIGGSMRPLDDATYKPFVDATDLLYNGTLVNERVACIGPAFIKKNIERFHPTTRTLYQQVLDRGTNPWDVYADQLVQAEAARKANLLLSGGVGDLGGVGDSGCAVDVLVVPTAPFHPSIAEMQADPITLNAKIGVFTHFGNVLDLCAMSVPAGTVDGGMPFGVCFVCAKGMDGRLFDIAAAFERAMSKKA